MGDFEGNLTDIWYGNEVVISVGWFEDEEHSNTEEDIYSEESFGNEVELEEQFLVQGTIVVTETDGTTEVNEISPAYYSVNFEDGKITLREEYEKEEEENQIDIEYYYMEGDGEWKWEQISYDQGFSPDFEEDTEAVHDGLRYAGEKRIIAENELEMSQLFRGFDIGLDKFENQNGLVAKAEIVPDGGVIPLEVEEAIYMTNFNTTAADLDDIPNEGEFNISLSGRFDEKVYASDWETQYEDIDNVFEEEWVVNHYGDF